MQWLEVIIVILGLVVGVAEFYVWYTEILWHKSESRR